MPNETAITAIIFDRIDFRRLIINVVDDAAPITVISQHANC